MYLKKDKTTKIYSYNELFEEYSVNLIHHIGRYRTPKKVIKIESSTPIWHQCDICNSIFSRTPRISNNDDFKKIDFKKETLCKECLTKRTTIKKYGVSSTSQVPYIKEKISKSNKITQNTDRVKNQIKKTKFDHYGDENYNNRDKAKKTNLERYDMEGIPRDLECRNRISAKNKLFYNSDEGILIRENMSKNKKLLYSDKKNHPMYGKHHTKESNEKNRQSQFKYLKKHGLSNKRSKYVTGEFYSSKTDTIIKYRSSYEKWFYYMLEHNNEITNYEVENISIPYYFEGKNHLYFPDVLVEFVNKKSFLIEIKPEGLKNHPLNIAKWKSAELWSKEKNIEFIVLSENNMVSFIIKYTSIDTLMQYPNKWKTLILDIATKVANTFKFEGVLV